MISKLINFRIKLWIVILIALPGWGMVLSGCGTVPREILTVGDKITQGINKAKQNQIDLIRMYAKDAMALEFNSIQQKAQKEINEKLADNCTPEIVIQILADADILYQQRVKQLSDIENNYIDQTTKFFNGLLELQGAQRNVLEKIVSNQEGFERLTNAITSVQFKQLIKEVENGK